MIPTTTTTTTITTILLFLMTTISSSVKDDHLGCLCDFRSSFDPQHLLSSWDCSNTTTAGFLCAFTGINCWNIVESRIVALSLPSLSLSGPFAHALSLLGHCPSITSSITSLDLSSNSLSGPIPASVCQVFPYLVSLDLSSNNLTGPIPSELADCRFLNSLDVSNNRLSGPVPASLARLIRLRKLDVSNNDLSGPIPFGLSKFNALSFSDNPLLCGGDTVSFTCEKPSTSTIIAVNFFSGVFGFVLSIAISYIVRRCFFSADSAASGKKKKKKKERREEVLLSSSHSRLASVSLFGNPMTPLKLADLMAATKDFHPDNIVVAGSFNLGTSYTALLPDGSALIVKRLHHCILTEQHFRAEMERIGRIRHPNLAPLLGFFFAEEDRLLVYKNIENGALSSMLQSKDENLNWPTRLRIAVGVARGLLWLHHGFQVPFLHQNFSSKAVLLDEDYEPRIIDFGLTTLHVSQPVDFSTKEDVYEFGVVLLELATDRSKGFIEDLANWMIWLCVTGQIHEAIGESLRGKGDDDEIVAFLEVACECVAARPQERPSMYEVYGSLKRIGGMDEFSKELDDEFHVVCSKELDASL